MVCKLPSARSLSKARSEGALRENMAKADMSASAKAISVSPTRSSGRLAKPLCTKRKSASADRCFRPCGATMDMENPITRRSKRSSQGVFSHLCLRKASSADTVVTRLGGSSGIADLEIVLKDTHKPHISRRNARGAQERFAGVEGGVKLASCHLQLKAFWYGEARNLSFLQEALAEIKTLQIREPRVACKAVLGESLEEEARLLVLLLFVALHRILCTPC